MYIFLKRLVRELLLGTIEENSNKFSEDELVDDQKIREKYGICTYIIKLRDTDNALMMSEFARNFSLVLGIGTGIVLIIAALFGIVFPKDSLWIYIFIPSAYIFLIIIAKINKDIYSYYKNIVTRDKIIMRRAYKKDRIVTYEEISKAAKKKKIVIRKGSMYIPTSRKPVRVEMFENVDSKWALEQIKEKSKITIPEITEKRMKYMGMASLSVAFNIFGYVFLFMAFISAADHYENVLVEFCTRLVTQDYCIFFGGLGIGCLVIGKIFFVLGQYKLRKDINDPKHVKVRLL